MELEELSEAVRDEDKLLTRVDLRALHAYISELGRQVNERECVGVVVVDASELTQWERQHGSAAFDSLMGHLATALRQMRGSALRIEDTVCLDADGGEAVYVFLSGPREDRPGPSVDFEQVVRRVRRSCFEHFEGAEWLLRNALDQVAIGSSLIIHNDSVDPRREIYRAIRKAKSDAQYNHNEVQRQRHRVVGHMIAQRKINTLYQPIVDMQTGGIVGYEALSRAAESDADRLGVHLFVAASKADLDGELDQTCRTLSIRRRPKLNGDVSLFVNSLPPTFYEPMRDLEQLLDAWEADGLRPDQLVFEITENITHTQLNRILPSVAKLRARGYRFAVDDVGTGESNLQLIADLEPDFIKMDISLVRGISSSSRKQALASYLLELAKRCDAELIAEGIEEQSDMDRLQSIGVRLGQGYLLGRPASVSEAEELI